MPRAALRSSLAFAEAVLPGGAGVPAADEATVGEVEALLAHVSPRVVTAFRWAQRTLDAAARLATGRPFHRLDRAAQDALLARWERDPVLGAPLNVLSMAYKFVHFDRERVYEALGGQLHVVRQLEQPRWLDGIVAADDFEDAEVECEVVVVGTGAGGAVVGKELADAGYAVVFVEEGDHYRRDAFDGSSVRAHATFYRAAFSVGNAPIPIFVGRMVGGSTAVNTGTCFRTPDWVLERWCRELGSDDFSPENMDPWFEKVERTLPVEPADRRFVGAIADVFARGCETLGWQHGPMLRNAPGCEGTGFCDFGCPTDSRRSTNLSYLPPAIEKGSLVLTGLRADEVLVEGGRAAGVRATSRGGRAMTVRAPVVVFAGGTIPTPAFLRKQGIGVSSGHLGRHLTVHPSGALSALFDEPIRGQDAIPSGWGSTEFLRDGILLNAAQPDRNIAAMMFPVTGSRLMRAMEELPRTASFGVLAADETRNGRIWTEVGGTPAITYNLTPRDVRRIHEGMIRLGEMCWAAGAKRLLPSLTSFPVVESPADFERFKKHDVEPGDLMLTSYHPLGTAQMAADPRDGVVDRHHETFDLPGLYVVDGSSVRGPLGVNSQITIMALATRAAHHLADRLAG